jgi:hypothetical protein
MTKEKTKEIFELGEKEVVREGTVNTPKSKPGQKEHQEKILRNILVVIGVLILIAVGYYLYAQSQIHFTYKGIKYEAALQGDLMFYETRTLLDSNDGANSPFGFRIRTKPSKLKRIDFIGIDQFELMKVNGYKMENGSFNCEGDGIIAFPNIIRLFQKMGSTLISDQNEVCDEQGRYNFFIFKYGDKTQINEIGNHCYEVTVKGSDEVCEILPATEKIMVEIFAKYKIFQDN